MKGPIFSESAYIWRPALVNVFTGISSIKSVMLQHNNIHANTFTYRDHRENLSNRERVWKIWSWTGLDFTQPFQLFSQISRDSHCFFLYSRVGS